MKKAPLLLLLAMPIFSFAQPSYVNKVSNPQMLAPDVVNVIDIPKVGGYTVLKCDFHLHSMFSDGSVWPTVRVDEAYRDGLDAIALTDHIEYRPYSEYLTGDLNTSYLIAKEQADLKGVILVRATEITRDKSVGGHLNALFISDANELAHKDAQVQVDRAIAQKAFIIWNHPGWAVDSCVMYGPNREWLAQGKIHAVEVFNEQEYYPRATTWVRHYKGLAPVACSDAHAPIDMVYADGVRRPITLVMVDSVGEQGLREALFAQRTLAWFNGQVAGQAEWLGKLFRACVGVERGGKYYALTNGSDVPFVVKVGTSSTLLRPHTTTRVGLPKGFDNSQLLQVEVTNLHTSEDTNLSIGI